MREALALALAVLALSAGQTSAAAHVGVRVAGTTTQGAEVHEYTLDGGARLKVQVLDLGGIITRIEVPDRRGKSANVTLSLQQLRAYETAGAINGIVGRYANRIRGGFDLDGVHYALPADASGVTLHSGPNAYWKRIWAAVSSTTGAEARLRLRLTSPDGDQGFPGRVDVQVTYTVIRDSLRIDYQAVADRPTVINLTNHLYLNLAGGGPVGRQRLQVFAEAYTPTDQDRIPTGAIAPLAGTALDFRRPHPIGLRIASAEPQMVQAHGYDHNFVLNGEPDALHRAARLQDPGSGRLAELWTTEPGLQVYTANAMTGALVSTSGTTIRQGYAVALEPQHFPDSPNHPEFPSTVLRPGQVFRSTTVLKFLAADARRAGAIHR